MHRGADETGLSERHRRIWLWLRQGPFWAASIASVLKAAHAPEGRRPPEFDFTLSFEAIRHAADKPQHIIACALIFWLATLAFGRRRLWLAAGATMMVGLGWEIAQTTVIGHNPRLADLAPDAIGVAAAASPFMLYRVMRRRGPGASL